MNGCEGQGFSRNQQTQRMGLLSALRVLRPSQLCSTDFQSHLRLQCCINFLRMTEQEPDFRERVVIQTNLWSEQPCDTPRPYKVLEDVYRIPWKILRNYTERLFFSCSRIFRTSAQCSLIWLLAPLRGWMQLFLVHTNINVVADKLEGCSRRVCGNQLHQLVSHKSTEAEGRWPKGCSKDLARSNPASRCGWSRWSRLQSLEINPEERAERPAVSMECHKPHS